MKTAISKTDYEYICLLRLISSVVNGILPEPPQKPVNWQDLYYIAANHSLSAMLYEAVSKLTDENKPPENISACLAQLYREQMVTDINLTVETERILSLFSQNGIEAMPFKGIVTKNDYPKTFFRTMSDVDILVKEENREEAEQILLKEGYTRESVGVKDSSFRKDKIMHFEIHSNLLEEEAKGYSYFSKIWSRAEQKENRSFAMSPEDTYIFMLEHLANHLLFGGAGLRMYLDVYLFLKKHNEKLDRMYIDSVLQELSLTLFESETVKLAQSFFSSDSEPDLNSDAAKLILNSATFGSKEVHFTAYALKSEGASSTKNGFKIILSKTFPSYKVMRLKYKAVSALPVLYPLFIPVFWFERIFLKRNVNTANISSYFISAHSDKAKKLKDIYISLGLENRL